MDEETKKNTHRIKEFQVKNEFDNFFRTSVKMDINITETMNYLIETIIDRMEKYSKMTGAPIGQKKRRDNNYTINDFSTVEQTVIKLDSNRVISSRKSERTKRSKIKSAKTGQEDQSSYNVIDLLPKNCC